MGQTNYLLLLLGHEAILLLKHILKAICLVLAIFDLILKLLIGILHLINLINGSFELVNSLISSGNNLFVLITNLSDLGLHISLSSSDLLLLVTLNVFKLSSKILDPLMYILHGPLIFHHVLLIGFTVANLL